MDLDLTQMWKGFYFSFEKFLVLLFNSLLVSILITSCLIPLLLLLIETAPNWNINVYIVRILLNAKGNKKTSQSRGKKTELSLVFHSHWKGLIM